MAAFQFIQLLFLVLISLTLAVVVLQFLGVFMPSSSKSRLTNSLFHTSEIVGNALMNLSELAQWRGTDYTIETGPGDTWTEKFDRDAGITYQLQSNSGGQLIAVNTVSSNLPFRLNRTYRIWHQDHMAFINVEDELIITKAYLRPLAALFYRHKSAQLSDLKLLETYLNKKHGLHC